MVKTRTFVDSALLILAACGTEDLSQNALAMLDDPDREYVSSDFVRLEVLPKAIYNGQEEEADFYRTFFDGVHQMIESSPELVSLAESEGVRAGLSALDALHVAAAKQGGCGEFITAEKKTKPLFRVAAIEVNTIRPEA